MLQGGKKVKRPPGRPHDCSECPKIPQDTRTELIQLGIKFGPERAIDIDNAHRFLIYYHETQAGAPYPKCRFQSKLIGMVHYLMSQDQHEALRRSSQTPSMMMAFMKATYQ